MRIELLGFQKTKAKKFYGGKAAYPQCELVHIKERKANKFALSSVLHELFMPAKPV